MLETIFRNQWFGLVFKNYGKVDTYALFDNRLIFFLKMNKKILAGGVIFLYSDAELDFELTNFKKYSTLRDFFYNCK